MTKKTLDLQAPGPGPWEYDYSHFDRPLPRYASDVFSRGYSEGQEKGFEHAGFPVRGVNMAVLEGYPYLQIVPVLGSPADTRLPPRWLFKLVGALHPTLRKRYRRAREYLEGRLWRDDVRRWDQELKPNLTEKLERLSVVELSELDDEGLVQHLEGALEALLDNLHAHFFVNPATILPVGRFLHHAEEWSGASASELLALVSHGNEVGDPALRDLVAALRSDELEGLVAPNGKAPGELLTVLARQDGAVGASARAWLARMSVRQLASCDLSAPNGAEVPELLVSSLRQALEEAERPVVGELPGEELRSRVPESERARFDELLEEARHVYRLRDERSTVLDVWAMGLVRRGILEAGRRLVSKGQLSVAEHAVDLEHHEVASLLRGQGGPPAEEVAERHQIRLSRSSSDAPPFLGGEPPPPPPADYFPPAVAEAMRAVFRYIDDMNGTMEPDETTEETTLNGRAAASGTAKGTARVVRGPADFARVEPGDILIARATMPSYNCVLPLLAGIVTDYGGALCHAAIVAREYRIPAVVNTRVATERIEDGATVEIDGNRGVVQIRS